MKHILFLCGHNSGRSQMAQAYFNHQNKNPEFRALSAGTHPAAKINEQALQVLLEEGIDIREDSEYDPKIITEDLVDQAEKIYTMGCNVDCQNVGKPITADLGLDDPHGQPLQKVREIFEELKEQVNLIIAEYNHSSHSCASRNPCSSSGIDFRMQRE